MKKTFLVQIGLAFTLFYVGIYSLVSPDLWISFVPKFVENFGVSRELFLAFHSIGEITLAIWLLTGWKLRISGSLTALLMASIVIVSGWDSFMITFRDVGLFFAALFLAMPEKENSGQPLQNS